MSNFKLVENYIKCFANLANEIKLSVKNETLKKRLSSYINSCRRVCFGSLALDDFPIDLWGSLKIEHIDGFSINVRELYQYKLYDGLLAGYPMESSSYIDHVLKTAKRIFLDKCQKAHILPTVVSYGKIRSLENDFHFFTSDFEVLPPTASMAILQNSEAAEYVFLIWFQNQFGQIEHDIIIQIKTIPWAKYAVSYSD